MAKSQCLTEIPKVCAKQLTKLRSKRTILGRTAGWVERVPGSACAAVLGHSSVCMDWASDSSSPDPPELTVPPCLALSPSHVWPLDETASSPLASKKLPYFGP